jgi:hypothetical protein
VPKWPEGQKADFQFSNFTIILFNFCKTGLRHLKNLQSNTKKGKMLTFTEVPYLQQSQKKVLKNWK